MGNVWERKFERVWGSLKSTVFINKATQTEFDPEWYNYIYNFFQSLLYHSLLNQPLSYQFISNQKKSYHSASYQYLSYLVHVSKLIFFSLNHHLIINIL